MVEGESFVKRVANFGENRNNVAGDRHRIQGRSLDLALDTSQGDALDKGLLQEEKEENNRQSDQH